MNIILIIIAIYLDGIISTIVSQNSFCIPHILLTTLFFIYPKYTKKENIYNILLIISGLFYDMLYTNLLFLHAIIFFLIGKLIKFFYKNLGQNIIMYILSFIITIATYILFTSFLLIIFKTTSLNITTIIQYIIKSIFINIIYLLLIKFVIKKQA